MDSFKVFLIEKGGVDQSAYKTIENEIATIEVKKGESLLKAGEVCHRFFFVQKGLLRTYSLNDQGEINILQFSTEGWIAADRGSYYFNLPSVYYIDAIEDTTAIVLDEKFTNLILEVAPVFSRFNEKLIQNHVRHLNKRITSLLGDSAESRYLKFVELYPDVLLRVPQWMVASYLGITPESLSRVRRALAKKNFGK
ncbi:Crp/Fnr family transcriptional regulator [Galbibacter sp.]|uniref:Crp/Fnr family transcriptional regulator n=1 Tax=Galbibacter sp. TaxID=2918471 RepID=UPI003A9033E6